MTAFRPADLADDGGSVNAHAIEFVGNPPTDKQPYKPQGDGSTTVLLDVGEQDSLAVEQFWKSNRGKNFRVLVEVSD